MQTRKLLSLTVFIFISSFCFAQQHKLPEVQLLSSGTNTSLRGLSVVTENVVWVSGSNGTVGKT
ncbi:MAG: oxidoreductase, partial [Bacteroidetes bacterium]|nr:oxidoreductase [Bacteroidota bacterium]